MADTPAPEFLSFIADERRAKRLAAERTAAAEGDVSAPVFIDGERATPLLRVIAQRAVGFYRPTKHTQVVWVHGDSELTVVFSAVTMKTADGMITVTIPVHCDQTGDAAIAVFFAVGSATQPAGLYASTLRRPNGPPLIIGIWSEALVAFAWQCVLGLVSGIAGATGKDARGNILVPIEMVASAKGIQIVPMARHRFSGSSGLKTTTIKAAAVLK